MSCQAPLLMSVQPHAPVESSRHSTSEWPSPAKSPSVPPLPPSPIKEFASDPALHADFERALGSLKQNFTLPLNQALAIYCAVRYLTQTRVPGDIVDCGEGVPEVLALVARGLSNVEVGGRLYVTPATVKTHVSRLLMKLGVRDRAQLIIVAYETGLVTVGEA